MKNKTLANIQVCNYTLRLDNWNYRQQTSERQKNCNQFSENGLQFAKQEWNIKFPDIKISLMDYLLIPSCLLDIYTCINTRIIVGRELRTKDLT
jgi:hypothetical protein